MQFEVRGRLDPVLPRIADPLQLLADGDPVVVHCAIRAVDIEKPGHVQAAHHVRLEPGAFLVRKGRNSDRLLRLHAVIVQRPDHFESRKNAERPVVRSRVAHRIEVRPHDDRFGVRIPAGPDAADIADRVDNDVEAFLPKPFHEEIPARAVLVAQRKPGPTRTPGMRSNRPHLVEGPEQPFRGDPHLVHMLILLFAVRTSY